MRARKSLVLAVVLVAAAARAASADPAPATPATIVATTPTPATIAEAAGYLHLASPSSVTTDGGSNLRLPPGYFFDEPAHAKLDVEFKRRGDAETRLTAENASLRSQVSGWSPGWRTLLGALVVGAAGGAYAYHRL